MHILFKVHLKAAQLKKSVTIISCWNSYSRKLMQLEYFIINLP